MSSSTAVHTCGGCGKGFKSAKTLLEHRTKNRCNNKPSALQCVCGEVFSSRQRKHDHRKRNPNCAGIIDEASAEPDAAGPSTSTDSPKKTKVKQSMEGVNDFYETNLDVVYLSPEVVGHPMANPPNPLPESTLYISPISCRGGQRG